MGTLSQRGRFHGWEKVHDAAAEVLHRGLWKPNGDEEILGGTGTVGPGCKGEEMEVSILWMVETQPKYTKII